MTMPFYLAQPWWLFLWLLPVALWAFNRWRVRQLAQDYCASPLMAAMRLAQDQWRDLPWSWLTVWLLLVFALCQPKWVSEDTQAQQRPIQWVVVVDLSDSMQAQDVQPSRLQQARWLLESALTHWQQGDKVGLIAFSASHHWLMPLTTDKRSWQTQLALLEARLLPLRGSLLQHTMAEVDKQLPANVGVLIVTDGGGIDVTQSAHRLSRPALMVVLGQGAAALPPSVADGAGIDVGVPVRKVERLAHDWGVDWVRGEQASLDLEAWLSAQRQAVVALPTDSGQDVDLSPFFLLLAMLVWLRFWRFERLQRLFFALIALILLLVVLQQGHAAEDQQTAAQASRVLQKAFRDALTEADQLQALQGLAASLQAQSDWLSAAQTWRGVLAYQPENSEAKAQLKLALSHLPKSVDWSGEGGKRPKGGREGFIDDWPDMPEQEETKDVLQETSVKNRLEEVPQIPPSTSLIKRGSTEPIAASQLAQQQKQARTDTTFLGEARALGAQQRQFYQRLFEQEAGFAAAQSEPQIRDGIAPW